MNDRVAAFELPQEQQHTVVLLEQILGRAIADRYVDFWRLSAGAFDLRVSRPLAAHAIRELDSTLRTVLTVPMEAVSREGTVTVENNGEAERVLTSLGYDAAAVQRAVIALQPRSTHRAQIERICERLGLGSHGEVAKLWKQVSDSAGSAHARSFHQVLHVDADFRSRYQVSFDTVIRSVAKALEGRYISLLKRVEQLASMEDRGKAVKLFAREIPGALPLQRHFFLRLDTGAWLVPLESQGLLGEPIWDADDAESNARFTDWPAGEYLVRMAASDDSVTRENVVGVLRALGSSTHPAVRNSGLAALAALPISESAGLVALVVSWLDAGGEYLFQKSAETFLSNLSSAGLKQDVLRVARSLLQIRKEGTKLVSIYAPDLYQNQLPALATLLIDVCGSDGLHLLIELLTQAGNDDEMLEYGFYSQRPITDDENAAYEIFPALLSAVRKGADRLVDKATEPMNAIVGQLEEHSQPIFKRLVLHVLSKCPGVLPQLASSYLENSELIEGSWCQHEYAELALAWFAKMPSDGQARILAVIDSLPLKYKRGWYQRFSEHKGSPPTAEDERKFADAVYRDAAWRWRAVLPAERRVALEEIAIELGDPDAWRERLFSTEESPLTEAEFLDRPVSATVEFLRSWREEKGERRTQAALALALRDAVGRDPARFSAEASLFGGLAPVYVNQLLRGLYGEVANKKEINWDGLLALIVELQDKTALPEWYQALVAGVELVAAGLRTEAAGLTAEHSNAVQSLLLTILAHAPASPEQSDFEERFERDPYVAALSTLRGSAVDAGMLFVWWLSKDATSIVGRAPRLAFGALEEIAKAFERELADKFASGRIPRAVLGRYLSWLEYFGANWLRLHVDKLFPPHDAALRGAAWIAHLTRDRGPDADLMFALEICYRDQIALLANANASERRDVRRERLADYLLVLHIWNPSEMTAALVEDFLVNAPPRLRRYALSFVGKQAASAATEGKLTEYERTLAYWMGRLSKATSSVEPEAFREEVGALGLWFAHASIDDEWLIIQLREMIRKGFVPTQSSAVVQRLAKMAAAHSDAVAEVVVGLLKNPRTDRWMFFDRRPLQTIFQVLLSSGSVQSINQAEQAISILSSRGDTSFVSLLPQKL